MIDLVMLENEVALLQSGCYDGEVCDIVATNPRPVVSLNLCKLKDHEDYSNSVLQLTVELEENYPHCSAPPHVVVKSTLINNANAKRFATFITDTLKEKFLGEPMLWELCELARGHFSDFANDDEKDDSLLSNKDNTNDIWFVSVTQLDHIRDKRGYVKTLSKWAKQLDLCGKLLLGCPRILLVLWGRVEDDLKQFHLRHRTTLIDVDSSGKPCKERLAKLLCIRTTKEKPYNQLELVVEEFTSSQQLEKTFDLLKLSQLYNEYVK